MALYYLETGSTDARYNLAFEEFVLENRRQGDWLLLWQNADSVIIGLNQNAAEEVDPAFIRRHGIRVVRRMTGGGAVYHDLGNLNYSFITDAEDPAQLSMEVLARPVCRALEALGVERECFGDIIIDSDNSRALLFALLRKVVLQIPLLILLNRFFPPCFSTRTRRCSRARSGRTRRSSAPRRRRACAAGCAT